MRRRARMAGALLAGAAATLSCAGQDPPAAGLQSRPAPPMPPQEARMFQTLEDAVAAARADAAGRTGLGADALVLVDAAEVTWPDGSLGCPVPGRMYAQALVPGWRVRLQAGDTHFDYHADRRGHFVLCPAGRAVDPLPGAARM